MDALSLKLLDLSVIGPVVMDFLIYAPPSLFLVWCIIVFKTTRSNRHDHVIVKMILDRIPAKEQERILREISDDFERKS